MTEFTEHTAGLSDRLKDELSETGMDLSTLIKYMDMDNRPALWLEATALCNAAPSLLARAEGAEERVRVLEGQNADMREAALRLIEEAIHIGRHIPVSGQGEYDKLIAAVYAVRSLAALATTGVQHG